MRSSHLAKLLSGPKKVGKVSNLFNGFYWNGELDRVQSVEFALSVGIRKVNLSLPDCVGFEQNELRRTKSDFLDAEPLAVFGKEPSYNIQNIQF